MSASAAATRRSRRLAGEEPEYEQTQVSKSATHEDKTEWKRLTRLDSCLFAGKLLATSFASLITFTTTFHWYSGTLPHN